MKLGKKKLIKNDVLVLEVDNAGILLSKKFYNKNDMNNLSFDEGITGINYQKNHLYIIFKFFKTKN